MSGLSETVKVRVSPEERELLERVAEREGRKLSGLIRHATVTYCQAAEAPELRQHEIERTPPPGCIGVADEYGTIWSGEPGAAGSRRIGDLVLRYDEETSWVVIEK